MSEESSPPVCKIFDYKKYQYEKEKKAKENKKVKVSEVKEIKLGSQIMDHDIAIKVKNARRILDDGDKVKLTLKFRGREIERMSNGEKILNKCISMLSDEYKPVGKTVSENNTMYVIIAHK